VGLEEGVRLSGGVAGLDRLFDDPLGVDHIRDTAGVAIACVGAGSVGQAERAIGVAEDRVGEVELLDEGGVLRDAVEGGAEDGGVGFG
jgi:hypothetical protein